MGEVREGLAEMASCVELGEALAVIGLFQHAPAEADLTGEFDGPDWIDPAADHHRDLTALTSAIRRELAQATHVVNGTLDMIDKPCNA